MLIGIVALASLLKFLFANYPLPTSTTFIGLILEDSIRCWPKSGTRSWAAFPSGVRSVLCGHHRHGAYRDVSNPDTLTVDVGQMVILLVMGAGSRPPP